MKGQGERVTASIMHKRIGCGPPYSLVYKFKLKCLNGPFKGNVGKSRELGLLTEKDASLGSYLWPPV